MCCGRFDSRRPMTDGVFYQDPKITDEALFAEMKSDIVVTFSFHIVEVPLSAWLTPQTPNARILGASKVPHVASSLMRFPLVSVKTTVLVERDE